MAFQDLATNQLFNTGLGLLGASGPSAMPGNFGQRLGQGMAIGNQRQQAGLETEAFRNAMLQKKQRQEAMGQLQGLMQVPQGIRAPDYQQQVTGLLGQIAPEAMVQGMMAQQFAGDELRTSTSINDFKALNPGVDIGSPQGRDQYMAFLQEKDPTNNLMEQAQLELMFTQLEEARDARLERQETASQQKSSTRRAAVTDLSHLKELAQLNDRLDGTMLETGLPWPEARRALAGGVQSIQSALGVDNSEAKKLKADYDRYSKLTQDFVINSLDRLAGGGAITNTKFDALLQANAGVGSSPEANRLIFADNIEAILDGMDAGGFETPANADEYMALATQLRGEPEQTGGLTIESLQGMQPEELLAIPESELTDEMANAIADILEAGL